MDPMGNDVFYLYIYIYVQRNIYIHMEAKCTCSINRPFLNNGEKTIQTGDVFFPCSHVGWRIPRFFFRVVKERDAQSFGTQKSRRVYGEDILKITPEWLPNEMYIYIYGCF